MSADRLLTLADLDEVLEGLLLGELRGDSTPALLGIEFERLVLRREDLISAPLDACRGLMERFADVLGAEPVLDGGVMAKMRGGDFGLSMEPGGQLEIDTTPQPRLAAIDAIFHRVDAQLEAVLAATPYELVGLGHAPVTPASGIGLLPRERYLIMDREMIRRGRLSRHMMRATAGLQMAYDHRDRADAACKLALLNRLSPVLMAISANSRRIAGEDSGYASFRHHVWLETDVERSGVPDGCLHAETAIAGYVRAARRATTLFRHGPEGHLEATPAQPFEELVAAGALTRADAELHLSSMFPFVRLRGYVEVRCFDSVPWSLARGILAMLSGIVYCPDATARSEALSSCLVVDDPAALRAFHERAARDGLDAVTPDGSATLRELAGELVEYSCSMLSGCAWAAAGDVDPVRARLAGGPS